MDITIAINISIILFPFQFLLVNSPLNSAGSGSVIPAFTGHPQAASLLSSGKKLIIKGGVGFDTYMAQL